MSGPQTEAGKALRNWVEWAGAKAKFAGVPSETLIAAIEQEAVRAYKAELAAQIAALPQPTLGLAGGVSRAAVLALLNEPVP